MIDTDHASQGEDLKQKVIDFFTEHSLKAEAVPVVEKKLRAAARKTAVPHLLLALPVVLDDGRFRVLAVHENTKDSGDNNGGADSVNVTQVVRKAFAQWNVSLEMENYEAREEAFIERVEEILQHHLKRKVLIELPLDAPDGRKLLLQVRQGQQHDLETTVRCFVEAVGLPLTSSPQIINVLKDRLPTPLVCVVFCRHVTAACRVLDHSDVPIGFYSHQCRQPPQTVATGEFGTRQCSARGSARVLQVESTSGVQCSHACSIGCAGRKPERLRLVVCHNVGLLVHIKITVRSIARKGSWRSLHYITLPCTLPHSTATADLSPMIGLPSQNHASSQHTPIQLRMPRAMNADRTNARAILVQLTPVRCHNMPYTLMALLYCGECAEWRCGADSE